MSYNIDYPLYQGVDYSMDTTITYKSLWESFLKRERLIPYFEMFPTNGFHERYGYDYYRY